MLKPSDGMCDQKGSFVDDEKLRFDFSWSGSLTAEQVQYVHLEKSVTGRAMLAFGVCEVPYSKRFLDVQVTGIRSSGSCVQCQAFWIMVAHYVFLLRMYWI